MNGSVAGRVCEWTLALVNLDNYGFVPVVRDAVSSNWFSTLRSASWLCWSSHCQASAGIVSGPAALLCASRLMAACSSSMVMGLGSAGAVGWMGSVGPEYGAAGAAQCESLRYSANVCACCVWLVGLPCDSRIETGLGL